MMGNLKIKYANGWRRSGRIKVKGKERKGEKKTIKEYQYAADFELYETTKEILFRNKC